MAFAAPISVSQAKDYYYENDPLMNELLGDGKNTQWFGKGAHELGLSGIVN